MKWLSHYVVGGALVAAMGLCLVVATSGCKEQKAARDAALAKAQDEASAARDKNDDEVFVLKEEVVVTCDGKGKATIPSDVVGQTRADALLDQWKRDHPDSNWVEEERKAHAFKEPADNSDVLKGGQAKGHAYGDFTETDLLIWARETKKFVAEGSRIFHSGDRLGSTVGVSCDMCHPHAANTHPETYPKFQTQLGRVVLLRDMINWCIENPVRGKKLEADSAEMRALEAYIMAERKGVEMNYGKH